MKLGDLINEVDEKIIKKSTIMMLKNLLDKQEESSCGSDKEEVSSDVEEDSPPGDNYKRMVKHLKDKFGKDSEIPYQIAWSKYNKRSKK